MYALMIHIPIGMLVYHFFAIYTYLGCLAETLKFETRQDLRRICMKLIEGLMIQGIDECERPLC